MQDGDDGEVSMNHKGGPRVAHGFRRRVTDLSVLREPEWGMANKQRQLSEDPTRCGGSSSDGSGYPGRFPDNDGAVVIASPLRPGFDEGARSVMKTLASVPAS